MATVESPQSVVLADPESAAVTALSNLLPPDAGEKRTGGAGDLSVFRAIPLFSTLSDAELEAIASHSREVTYTAGQVAVEQGSAGNVFYSVRSGAVEVSQSSTRHLSKVVAQLGAGDCFGETAMLKDGVRSATVRALSDTVLIELATEAFEKVVAPGAQVSSSSGLLTGTSVRTYAARMQMTATRLRSELYRILDRVLETGESVEVVRTKGTVVLRPLASLRIARKRRKPKGNPNLVVGDPDELVHFDWSKHWKPFL